MKQAGRRDRYITIKQITNTQDSYGQPVVDLVTATNWWAEVIYKGSAKESFTAHQTHPEKDVTFVTQHTNPTGSGGFDLREDDIITYNGETFDILGIEELGRRDGLRIFAKRQA